MPVGIITNNNDTVLTDSNKQRPVVSIGDGQNSSNLLEINSRGFIGLDEDSIASILYLLSAILEKLPRVTGNDQAAVTIEGGSVGISTNQTLQTLQTFGGQDALTVSRAQQLSGTSHIYNNIVVA